MRKIGLFLDTKRDISDITWINYPDDVDWSPLRSQDTFLFVLFNCSNRIDYISFDYELSDADIHGNETSGGTCLKLMIDGIVKGGLDYLPKCFFHTQDIDAKEIMEAYYKNFIKSISDLGLDIEVLC